MHTVTASTQHAASVVGDGTSDASDVVVGVYAEIGRLPPDTPITEEGLAKLFGKCRDSIKSAVDREELPRPARIMGKPTWTVRAIIRHIEMMLESEARKSRKHSA